MLSYDLNSPDSLYDYFHNIAQNSVEFNQLSLEQQETLKQLLRFGAQNLVKESAEIEEVEEAAQLLSEMIDSLRLEKEDLFSSSTEEENNLNIRMAFLSASSSNRSTDDRPKCWFKPFCWPRN